MPHDPRALAAPLALAAAALLCPTVLLAQGPPPRRPYRSTCGNAIRWERDHARALERAEKEQKPIFWYVPAALSSPMDRRQELHWVQRGAIYSDPAVIELLNEHFVPLELSFAPLLDRGDDSEGGPAVVEKDARRALAERYGLTARRFIEPGFALLDARGELVHVCDRLSLHENRWFGRRLARIFAEHGKALFGERAIPRLRTLGEVLPPVLSGGLAAMQGGDHWSAEKEFAMQPEQPAALFLRGACLHVLGRGDEGDAVWKKLGALRDAEPWSGKAQLELDRWGPFLLGYERYRKLPEGTERGSELRTSATGAALQPREELSRPALWFLVDMPRSRGLYRDSRYDFGGSDSLPNVHVAVSALAALALLEGRELLHPEIIAPVLDELRSALLDEQQLAANDEDEIVWAHACRALFFARSAELEPEHAATAKAKLREIVQALASSQLDGGGWRHEYPNAFTTGFVLYALQRAGAQGATFPPEKLASAGEALARVRGESGSWPYGFGRPPKQAISSACRAPWCELGLAVAERSDAKRLEQALALAFQHHDALAAVRRYDDHSDEHHHGGFFFWFDMLGRAACATQLTGAPRTRYLAELEAQIASMREVDGTWIDSPEVGKVYGTAMALICLSLTVQ
ncbi:MAG: hypothetical protein JNM84_15145 [Planctomycetes bacterium]|nr:hypothetical protein [Planctomycetota bacterium]